MVNETGFAADLVVNGKFLTRDIPKIIRAGQNSSGWIPGTNRSNFFVNRGGYGCRHQIIPTRLLRRDRELIDTFDENVEEDINEINNT